MFKTRYILLPVLFLLTSCMGPKDVTGGVLGPASPVVLFQVQ